MSNSLRAAFIGFLLFFVGCGPAPVEIAPTAATVSKVVSATDDFVVTGFGYQFRLENSFPIYLARAASPAPRFGTYLVDLQATFSQFPAKIFVQSCLSSAGASNDCSDFYEIACDLGTQSCYGKGPSDNTHGGPAIALSQDSSGYTVRISPDIRIQGVTTTLPSSIKFKIQGQNSARSSAWTEAGCSNYAYPPLQYFQCR